MELTKSDDFFFEVETDQKPFYDTLLKTALKRTYKETDVLTFEEIKKLIPLLNEHDEIHVYFAALSEQINDYILKNDINSENIEVLVKHYFYKYRPSMLKKVKIRSSNAENPNFIIYSDNQFTFYNNELVKIASKEELIYVIITSLFELFDTASIEFLGSKKNIYKIDVLIETMSKLCEKAAKELSFVDYKKVISRKILKKRAKTIALAELKEHNMNFDAPEDIDEKGKTIALYHQSLFENLKLCVDGLVINNQKLIETYKILQNIYQKDGVRKNIYELINDKKQAKINLRIEEQLREKDFNKVKKDLNNRGTLNDLTNNLSAIDYFYSQLIFSELKYLYYNKKNEFTDFLNNSHIYPIKEIEDMSNYFIEHNNIEINNIRKSFVNKDITFEQWNNYSRYLSRETSEMQNFMAICQRNIVAKHFN